MLAHRLGFVAACAALFARPDGLAGQDSVSAPVVRAVTGDPGRAGRFVARITFPRGFHSEPHYHNVDVTGRVLRGRLLMGTGARFDTIRVVPFERRGSKVVRAREIHFDWWPDGGELEIEGEGPLETIVVDSTGLALPSPAGASGGRLRSRTAGERHAPTSEEVRARCAQD